MAIVNFADLRKSGQNSIEKLTGEAAKFNSGGYTKDERYWSPEVGKDGDGSAVIRFLPAPAGEDIPFVRLFSYGFKGPTGKWFIENSPSTIERPDPVAEFNSSLWDSGSEEKKEQAKQQKRRLSFITNIQVVRHKARPADEGKVFLYKFGKKIWDKVQDKMNPDDDDLKPINPFDLWTGANFRLKVKRVSNFPNYDDSSFDAAGPLSEDDKELEAIWRQAYSLQAEIAEEKFKSYAELKTKLDNVLRKGEAQSSRREESEGSVSNRPAPKDDDTPPWQEDSSSGENLDWLKDLASK